MRRLYKERRATIPQILQLGVQQDIPKSGARDGKKRQRNPEGIF